MSPRSEPADGQPDDNDAVDVIVPEYLLAVEQGKQPDREECIKNNPDSATALQSRFADLDTHLHRSQRLRNGDGDQLAIQVHGV